MCFEDILDKLYQEKTIEQLFCVGIHCAKDRKNEYGTAKILDYKGRGAKAALFNRFVLEELIPFIRQHYLIYSFKEKVLPAFHWEGYVRWIWPGIIHWNSAKWAYSADRSGGVIKTSLMMILMKISTASCTGR